MLGPPPEGPGGCLGRVLGAILEDFGSKMEFSWLSWAMFGHLGAKVGEQERKMRQLSEQKWIFGGLGGGGGDASYATNLGSPPLRIAKGGGWGIPWRLQLQT